MNIYEEKHTKPSIRLNVKTLYYTIDKSWYLYYLSVYDKSNAIFDSRLQLSLSW
jgi:hypothetical protein